MTETRAEAATRIVRAGSDFAETYQALAAGRSYALDVPRGTLELTRTNQDGLLHRYVLVVPDSYDPSRAYPVRVYLHGGVSRPDPGACSTFLDFGSDRHPL